MDERRAARLASKAASFYRNHDDFSEPQANQINTALWHQVRELPPDLTTAVVEHEGALPLILAADDEYLHAVEALPIEDEAAPATARLVVRRLDHERCRVSVETCYRGSRTWGFTRHATWRITIEDLELVVMTRTSEDGEFDDREALCRHLADTLGVKLEYPAASQLVEVG
jgi:hypothetical protein